MFETCVSLYIAVALFIGGFLLAAWIIERVKHDDQEEETH